MQLSSRVKGESMLDTVATLEALHVDVFVIRDAQAGVPDLVAGHVAPHVSVLSGGAGNYAHPTQGLLDALTIRQHKGRIATASRSRSSATSATRASRVRPGTRSRALGVGEVRLVAAPGLMPDAGEFPGCPRIENLADGIEGCDVVMMLRIQKERMTEAMIPDGERYFAEWGLNAERLRHAKPDAIVMHPQPMNRGIEISSEVADGPQSVIRDQVRNGVAVRMAVLETVIVHGSSRPGEQRGRGPA